MGCEPTPPPPLSSNCRSRGIGAQVGGLIIKTSLPQAPFFAHTHPAVYDGGGTRSPTAKSPTKKSPKSQNRPRQKRPYDGIAQKTESPTSHYNNLRMRIVDPFLNIKQLYGKENDFCELQICNLQRKRKKSGLREPGLQ